MDEQVERLAWHVVEAVAHLRGRCLWCHYNQAQGEHAAGCVVVVAREALSRRVAWQQECDRRHADEYARMRRPAPPNEIRYGPDDTRFRTDGWHDPR